MQSPSAACCQQSGQSGQVIGRHRQNEAGSHPFDATIDGLRHAADGLGPAEGFLESFNARFRHEMLNETLFSSLDVARQEIRAWHHDYNHNRPHSDLANIPPAEDAAKVGTETRAA